MTEKTKQHKAILIDVKNREVRTVEYDGTLKGMYKLIGCSCIVTAFTFPNEDTLFVDDDGLSKYDNFFYFEGAHQPFAGNGLIVGKEILDEEGDLIDTANPSLWSEWIKQRIKWYHINDLKQMASEGNFPGGQNE